MQYGIRLQRTEMDWKEFSVLLHGLMPKTPLGMLVMTRSEENKDILKHYTREQHQIRDSWRLRHNPAARMTDMDKQKSVDTLQGIFASAYGPEKGVRRSE